MSKKLKTLTNEESDKLFLSSKQIDKINKIGHTCAILLYSEAFAIIEKNFNIQYSVEPEKDHADGDKYFLAYTYIDHALHDRGDKHFTDIHEAQKWCLKSMFKIIKNKAYEQKEN